MIPKLKLKKIKIKLLRYYAGIVSQKTSIKSVALSFSIGTFFAVLPTPGFGAFIGLFLVYLFKRLNSLSLMITFAIWNPLVLTPVYFLNFKIGDWIIKSAEAGGSNLSFLSTVMEYSQSFLAGSLVTSIVIATFSYFMVFYLIKAGAKRKIQKKTERIKIRTSFPNMI
jgi:uncharacterized protein